MGLEGRNNERSHHTKLEREIGNITRSIKFVPEKICFCCMFFCKFELEICSYKNKVLEDRRRAQVLFSQLFVKKTSSCITLQTTRLSQPSNIYFKYWAVHLKQNVHSQIFPRISKCFSFFPDHQQLRRRDHHLYPDLHPEGGRLRARPPVQGVQPGAAPGGHGGQLEAGRAV